MMGRKTIMIERVLSYLLLFGIGVGGVFWIVGVLLAAEAAACLSLACVF